MSWCHNKGRVAKILVVQLVPPGGEDIHGLNSPTPNYQCIKKNIGRVICAALIKSWLHLIYTTFLNHNNLIIKYTIKYKLINIVLKIDKSLNFSFTNCTRDIPTLHGFFLPNPRPLRPREAPPYLVKLYFLLIFPTTITIFSHSLVMDKQYFSNKDNIK